MGSAFFGLASKGTKAPSGVAGANVLSRVTQRAQPAVSSTPYYAGKTPTLADSNNEYVHAAQAAVPNAAPAGTVSIQPTKPRSLGAFF
jgi:hypothetical protein